MNIEQFRARVAESAAAAHKAARHLSSLDEMAENDEYIQSPDLNVSTKTKKGMGHESSLSSVSNDANCSSEIPAVVEDLSTRFVDVISMAARSPSRSPLVASRTQSPTTLELTAKKPEIQTTKSALIPSVAAVYEQNSSKKAPLQPKQKTEQSQLSSIQNSKAPKETPINEKHALILQQLDYDSDSDSSDGEQTIDSNSQPHNALHEELEYEVNECIVSQESSSNLEKKDPNRFMTMTADLENEREALIANDTSISSASAPSHKDNVDGRGGLWGNNNALRGGTAGEETNKALKAGLSWVQKVATPQLNAISQHILTKVADSSRTDNSQSSSGSVPIIPSRSKEPQYKESDEENIKMTTSSAFLSADEIAEFEQMKSKSSQSAIVAMVLPLVEAIKGNQRMAFVAVTLILSIFVYYYSRKRSVDDVL